MDVVGIERRESREAAGTVHVRERGRGLAARAVRFAHDR
jgi:hypothetical protein